MHALTILKNDLFYDQYVFFRDHLSDLNRGTVWADQDFKSSNHFYNPYKKKRLIRAKQRIGVSGRLSYKSDTILERRLSGKIPFLFWSRAPYDTGYDRAAARQYPPAG